MKSLVRTATTAELVRAGTSARAIRSLVDAGELKQVSRGIYREISGSNTSSDDRFAAIRREHIESAIACARALPGAYLVGPTACIAHRLPVLQIPEQVHLARYPRLQTRRREVTGGRGWPHNEPGLSPNLGVKVQPAAAAIIETAAVDGVLAGLVPADAALRRGVVLELDAAAQKWGSRVGAARVRTLCALADGRRESPLETRAAWQAHIAGFHLAPQTVIRDEAGEWIARVDFVVEGLNVVVEADGIGKYRGHRDFKAERVRHNQIEELGWIVVRVCDEDLRCGRFIPRLADAVARAQVRPSPD